jgi:phosphonate transport system substrate-binding protein
MSTIRSIAVLAAAAALVPATACGSDDAEATGDSADATCPNGEIRFGVEPYEDPATLIPVYEEMGNALEEKLDCPIEISIADTYVAEILAMKNGELELGQFGPLGYVFAQRQAGAIPLVSFANEDGSLSTYTGGIWVPKDSDIASIEDLAGHTLALSEPGSTSGDAVPRKALIDAGVEEDVQVDYAGGHTEALLALVNGKVDAAEINSQTLAAAVSEGSFDEAEFTQIWESEPIANDPITVSPETSPEFQAAVKKALLSLEQEDVAPIGEYLDFTSGKQPIVEVTAADYQPVVDLADALGLTPDDL